MENLGHFWVEINSLRSRVVDADGALELHDVLPRGKSRPLNQRNLVAKHGSILEGGTNSRN